MAEAARSLMGESLPRWVRKLGCIALRVAAVFNCVRSLAEPEKTEQGVISGNEKVRS